MTSRRHALAIPREHGAWGILLVPLASGAAVGLWDGGRGLPLVPLTIAALALFWLRTPVESWLGTSPMRAQPGDERRLVGRVVGALTAIAAAALLCLFWGGRNRDLLWVGGAAALAFGAQALLKKKWRSLRMAAQMIGAAGLTATAPAAYYLATGRLDATAGSLWAANLLFAVNQIHFVQLRIHAAKLVEPAERSEAGHSFLLAQGLLMVLLAAACVTGWFSWYMALAFVPALVRGFAWFVSNGGPLAVRRLGWTELALAASFGMLLAAGFHLGS